MKLSVLYTLCFSTVSRCSISFFFFFLLTCFFFFFFFFQAEDGIRDDLVTGVQTCALPIFEQLAQSPERLVLGGEEREMTIMFSDVRGFTTIAESYKRDPQGLTALMNRSEERRVGKECRSRWSPYN